MVKRQTLNVFFIQIDSFFAKIEELFMVIVFVAMLIMMVVQVIARYVLMYPLPWSEELIRYLFVPSSFIGAALAVKVRGHIDITIINSILDSMKNEMIKKNLNRFIWLAADIVSFIVLSVFCMYTYDYMMAMKLTNQRSTAMNMPMFWVVGAMFLGVLLMVFHYAIKILLNVLWGEFQESEGH